MELALICLKQIIIMFLLVAVGFLCGKTGIIDKDTNSKLSVFVLDIINPVLIFMSYQTEFNTELLKGLGLSVALGAASYAMTLLLLGIIFRGDKSDKSIIVRFATVYSNCAFMGIPLLNGLFGSEGVLYITGYITVFNIMVWTHGVILFGGKESAKIKKILTSPSIIAIILGFICFVTNIRLPEIPAAAANYISGCNTPLAMICAGVTIAGTELKSFVRDKAVYSALLLRLAVCPVMFWAVFRWFGIPEVVFLTILVATGCPAAATGTMFALRYKKMPELSAMIFASTTLLSAVTLPLTVLLGAV